MLILNETSAAFSASTMGYLLPPEPMPTQAYSDQELLLWSSVLESYARDWDSTFDNRPSYYTQEFWYLFINCLKKYWQKSPMTMTQACQSMKNGSLRTREERIKKAVLDGYLYKQKHPNNGRETLLIPSPKLQSIIIEHLIRTLNQTVKALEQIAGDEINANA